MPVSMTPYRVFPDYRHIDPAFFTRHGIRLLLCDLDYTLAPKSQPEPDDALRRAAEAEGVQLGLLSDYDLTGEAPSAAGTLVLGYGSLKDEACASVGETLKKVCMAAREASVTV